MLDYLAWSAFVVLAVWAMGWGLVLWVEHAAMKRKDR